MDTYNEDFYKIKRIQSNNVRIRKLVNPSKHS